MDLLLRLVKVCGLCSIITVSIPQRSGNEKHTIFSVTPPATSERSSGWLDSIVNPHVLRCFLRPSLTEAPSLHRSYPGSQVLRPSPPPHTARPISHELPVDPY